MSFPLLGGSVLFIISLVLKKLGLWMRILAKFCRNVWNTTTPRANLFRSISCFSVVLVYKYISKNKSNHIIYNIHTYTHIYVHIYIHIYIHLYIYLYIYICLYIFLCVYHICVNKLCIYACVYVYWKPNRKHWFSCTFIWQNK